jgi:hypothetical protein
MMRIMVPLTSLLVDACSETSLMAWCFAVNLRVNSYLNAELNGIMFAIEITIIKNWINLWIESDYFSF